MTVRDVDVEYPFDDPDDGWFGRAIVVEEEPQYETLDEPPAPVPDAVAAPVEDFYSYYHDDADDADDTDDTDDDTFAADDTDPVADPAPVQPVTPVDDALVDADDSVDTDTWYMPVADPASATLDTLDTADTDTDTWYVPEADPASSEYSDAPPAEPDYLPAVQEPTAAIAAAPRPDTWDFTPTSAPAASSPAHQSHRAHYAAAAAVLAVALALVGAVFVIRDPGPATDDAAPVAPTRTAQPAPSSAAPALSAEAPVPQPPPGPLPPPAPPSPAEQLNPPPVHTRQYTSNQQTPDEPKKPQMNVTRAPMSATPPPPPAQDRNSATPGDAPKRRGFFR